MESSENNRRGLFSASMADSRHLRLFTILLLYISQGIPLGLFIFAIPAWMAANGAVAKDIAFVISMVTIPWSFKFIAGLIIDRYTMLAMGRRRSWIIGAQIIAIASLILFSLIDPQPRDVVILGMIALVVNTAVVFQDVAVDALTVDILPEPERSLGGAYGSGGQVLGIAASASLAGVLIHSFGASAAYLACAFLIGLITIHVIWTRERVGERRLPWSKGTAHQINLSSQPNSLIAIIKSLLRNTFSSQSLTYIPVLLIIGFTYGICLVAVPLIATEHTGWAEDQLGSLNATAQLIAGITLIAVGGVLVGKIGVQRSLWIFFVIFIALIAWMLGVNDSWGNANVLIGFVVSWTLLNFLLGAGKVVIIMRLCPTSISATQYSVFMAINNMGVGLASLLIGTMTFLAKPEAMFMLLMGVQAFAVIILLLAKFPTRQIQANTDDPDHNTR